MKKVLCFILTVCITLGLCSCRRVLDTEMFVQLANMPRSTVWISENQKIQLYDYGCHGSIINNDGTPVAISLIDYSMNKGSAYLQGYIDPTSNDLKPHTYEKEKLFDFFDATVEPNGVFHLKINWCDTNGAFDESVTALTFYPKASSETGFFKETKLISENPEFSFELNQDYYNDDLNGYLVSNQGTKTMLIGDMVSYTTSNGFGSELYFYDAVSYTSVHADFILSGTLSLEKDRYFFKLHAFCIGTVFDPSITEFELKPTIQGEVKHNEKVD